MIHGAANAVEYRGDTYPSGPMERKRGPKRHLVLLRPGVHDGDLEVCFHRAKSTVLGR